MEYQLFDHFSDAIFVLDEHKIVVYCNTMAANFCESSVPRLSRRRPIYDVFSVEDKSLFVSPNGRKGQDKPTALTETDFYLPSGKTKKVQVLIQPMRTNCRWLVVIRDVTLENDLHAKYKSQIEQKEQVIAELREAQHKLLEYSRNLEQMVAERTNELKFANETLEAIMDSLGQGFLTIDSDGICGPIYTQACRDILECDPAGKRAADVLGLAGNRQRQFELWLKTVFNQNISFESAKELGPARYKHSDNRHITLDYHLILNENNRPERLVLVATDKTGEHKAEEALAREREYAQMILKAVTNKSQFSQFLKSANERIHLLRQSLREGRFDRPDVFRALHTLEGEAAFFAVAPLRAGARAAQDALGRSKGGLGELIEAVDHLLVEFQEFMKSHMALFRRLHVTGVKLIEVDPKQLDAAFEELRKRGVDDATCSIIANKMLKTPIAEMFSHFDDLLKTLSEKTGKQVLPLEVHGGEIRVHTGRYESLVSSLVHVFRNAIDHGIELPEERVKKGKNSAGRIKVEIERYTVNQEPQICIVISDDGGGVEIEGVRRRIRKLNLHTNPSELSETEVLAMLFESGLSSKSQVGDISGRGVGLDAVRHEVDKLGGKVSFSSLPGRGASLRLELPDDSHELVLPWSA